ncbi:hypothetical protein CTheo_7464 [Ceratobasidium theobromae]|uniref:Uncharacterized protein n=1 Tax=Ceratobasidium theobromae TaxID=1582974 RepID=A0A5N5QBF9_9AGAM|nr:hypothetical protein CTheo_7464 [Ceratobasidium theobromae]
MSSSSSRSASPEADLSDNIVDERKPIDKNLPPLVQVSLDQWLEIWRGLAQFNRPHDRDIFALMGHFTDPDTGKRRRAGIDMASYQPSEADVFHQVCDIDSVIGVVLDDFPILPGAILKYYMLQSVTHTLSSDLHIPAIPVELEDGSTTVCEKKPSLQGQTCLTNFYYF